MHNSLTYEEVDRRIGFKNFRLFRYSGSFSTKSIIQCKTCLVCYIAQPSNIVLLSSKSGTFCPICKVINKEKQFSKLYRVNRRFITVDLFLNQATFNIPRNVNEYPMVFKPPYDFTSFIHIMN